MCNDGTLDGIDLSPTTAPAVDGIWLADGDAVLCTADGVIGTLLVHHNHFRPTPPEEEAEPGLSWGLTVVQSGDLVIVHEGHRFGGAVFAHRGRAAVAASGPLFRIPPVFMDAHALVEGFVRRDSHRHRLVARWSVLDAFRLLDASDAPCRHAAPVVVWLSCVVPPAAGTPRAARARSVVAGRCPVLVHCGRGGGGAPPYVRIVGAHFDASRPPSPARWWRMERHGGFTLLALLRFVTADSSVVGPWFVFACGTGGAAVYVIRTPSGRLRVVEAAPAASKRRVRVVGTSTPAVVVPLGRWSVVAVRVTPDRYTFLVDDAVEHVARVPPSPTDRLAAVAPALCVFAAPVAGNHGGGGGLDVRELMVWKTPVDDHTLAGLRARLRHHYGPSAR